MEVFVGIGLLAAACIVFLAWSNIRIRRDLHCTAKYLTRSQDEIREFKTFIDREIMIVQTDLEGKILHASIAFAEFMGYEQSALVGKSFRQILQPEALPEYYHDLWSSLAVTFGWRDEISGQKQSGKQFWAEINVVPKRDAAGVLESYHAIVHDISSNKQLEVLSVTDELTGLFNRRHFNHCFVRELVRSRRSKDAVVFAMIDVDHFKRYNDLYGHQKGDEVLRVVGELLRKWLRRPTDFSFRLGGEEFGVLLIQMSLAKAQEFLDRLRLAVQELAIIHEQNDGVGYVTISMGALYVENPNPEMESVYFREADTNLYAAKNFGRNRLVATAFKDSSIESS